MAKKKAKSVESHLPQHPPKKTGKPGIGPREHPGDLVQQDAARQAKDESPAEQPKAPEPEKLKVPGHRQKELPGMEARHIEELESVAREYADTRDQRMALNQEESDLKEDLLKLMKKHEKKVYRVEELEIKVVMTEETVKVKILKDKSE